MIYNFKYQRLAINIISLLYILLFVYAAVSKLLDFETFQIQLAQSPLLSAYAGSVAVLVPGVEILLSILLLFPRFRMPALFGCFGLMVMFTAYIVIILNFSDFVPCSCGGVLEKLTWSQHLIFNVAFIILAALAILFASRQPRSNRPLPSLKAVFWALGIVAILATVVVTGFFLTSEKKMHRNNAFIRRYPPHPLQQLHALDLGFSSYYFAGAASDKIYLGNVTAPLNLSIIDTAFSEKNEVRLTIDQMNLPFRSVKINIAPPWFLVSDGNVPIIFKGQISNWAATTFMHQPYYFNLLVPLGERNFAIRTVNVNKEYMLGHLAIDDSITAVFPPDLLTKQQDGIFDTEGQLLWNPDLQKIIYTYSYRNEYFVADAGMNLESRSTTIDTITQAVLDIAHNASKGTTTLGLRSIIINKHTATSGHYLFIQSERLGRFEPREMLNQASIIDVYDLIKNEYKFSFYLYDYQHKKMRSFIIRQGLLIALMEDYLVSFKLDSNLFDWRIPPK